LVICNNCKKDKSAFGYTGILNICKECHAKRMKQIYEAEEKRKMQLMKKGYSPDFVNLDLP